MLRRPAILLTGDEIEAANWIPYANKLLTKLDDMVQSQWIVDVSDDVTISVTSEGNNRKIHIHVEPPPTRAFVGLPYDSIHRLGWGSPYEGTEHEENGIAYGTEGVQDKSDIIITRGEEGAKLRVKRYPAYAEDYPDGPQWGNLQWISADGRTCVSWDGPATRGPQWVNNISYLQKTSVCWLGGGEPDRLKGNMYQGMHMTLGSVCSAGTQIEHAVVKWSNDENVTTGSGGFDHETMYSNKVYKDGKVLYQYPYDFVMVTGACVKDGYLHAVLGNYYDQHGNINEWLLSAPLDDLNNFTVKSLWFYGWSTGHGHPSKNTSVWAFNASGTKAVAIRDVINDDGEGEFAAGLHAIQLDVETGAVTILWSQADQPPKGGPEVTSDVDLDSPATEGDAGSVAETNIIPGEIIGAIDYKGDKIVYAYYGVSQFYIYRDAYKYFLYPGACDQLHDDLTDLYTGYMRFSEAPSFYQIIDQHDEAFHMRQANDLSPQYREEYRVYAPARKRVISVDARYAMCVLEEVSYEPTVRVLDANSGSPYFINENLTRPLTYVDDIETVVYVMGQEVYRADPAQLQVDQRDVQFLDNWTAPTCEDTGVPVFSWPYTTGLKATPVVWSWNVLAQTAYMQVIETGENGFDFLVSTRHRRPEADPVSIVGSWSYDDGLTQIKTLAELLQIGENYPETGVFQANFMPNGII